MFKRLIKTKVFWASVGGIFISIGTMVAGEVTIAQGLLLIVGSRLAMFFRNTVAKVTGQ